MEISRSSKLYRWNNLAYFMLNWSTPNTLCGYFWYTVISPVIFLGSIACISLAVAIIAMILTVPTGVGCVYLLHLFGWVSDNNATYLWAIDSKSNPFSYWLFMYALICDAFIFLVLFSYAFFSEKIKDFKRDHRNDPPEEKPKIMLFSEYVKAKKRKFCPIIKFTD